MSIATHHDSRRTPRVPLVRDVDCSAPGLRGRGRLADVSAGGVFLELLPPPAVGSVLQLRFRPYAGESPVVARARVVYTHDRMGAGCEFVELEEPDRGRVTSLVERQLTAPHREEVRRSGRVMVEIAVSVAGRQADGQPFEEEASIVTLSRNGAALALSRAPEAGSALVVRSGIRLFRASVVWVGSGPKNGAVRVGVQSRGLARAFGFEFPSPTVSEPASLQLERSRPEDLEEALALLRASDLPDAGVAESFRDYLVVRDSRRLAAVCGLETHGPHGLLRSLVVDAEYRGTGLGASLVEEAVTRAAARGLRDVYLLTTTARAFFLRHGFVDVPREQAPEPIRQSWEYRVGCPASAAFMRRPLASTR